MNNTDITCRQICEYFMIPIKELEKDEMQKIMKELGWKPEESSKKNKKRKKHKKHQ